jgi:ferric-dicitrate binding protein FerR (iron transport regulator)
MDRNDKIMKLLDMQEHPEQFDETALEDMQNDPEMKELMEATAQLKRAMAHQEFTMTDQEVEDEWQYFVSEHSRLQGRNWFKVAATFVGILFVTGITFAAVHFISHNERNHDTTPTQEEIGEKVKSVQEVRINNDSIAKTEPVVFDNVTLDSIVHEIAAYHHMDVELHNDQVNQLRFYFVWKQGDSLQEVMEKLNMFEPVNLAIENGKLIVR